MLTSELNQANEIIFPYFFSWWVGYWKSLAGKVVHHTLQELAVPCIQLGNAPHVQWDRETDLNVQERTCMLYILTPNIRRLSISVSSKACIPRIGLDLSNRKHCLGVPIRCLTPSIPCSIHKGAGTCGVMASWLSSVWRLKMQDIHREAFNFPRFVPWISKYKIYFRWVLNMLIDCLEEKSKIYQQLKENDQI